MVSLEGQMERHLVIGETDNIDSEQKTTHKLMKVHSDPIINAVNSKNK